MNYELNIVTVDGTSFRLLVSREVGETFNKEWQEWTDDITRSETKIFTVHGTMDFAKRDPKTIMILASSIIGTELYKV